jgi:hypothetical protein
LDYHSFSFLPKEDWFLRVAKFKRLSNIKRVRRGEVESFSVLLKPSPDCLTQSR